MSEFEPAVEFVLENEGGLSENAADPGGITNFGISLRFLKLVPQERLRRYGIFHPLSEDTIRDLTRDQAKLIYKGEFWDEERFKDIDSQTDASYIFDMCVNHGISHGIKLLQRAICARSIYQELLKEDGILGDKTLYEYHINEPMDSVLIAVRVGYIHQLIAVNPKLEVFLDGWLKRAYRI